MTFYFINFYLSIINLLFLNTGSIMVQFCYGCAFDTIIIKNNNMQRDDSDEQEYSYSRIATRLLPWRVPTCTLPHSLPPK